MAGNVIRWKSGTSRRMDSSAPTVEQFEADSERFYRRNFAAGLVHGVFFQASAAFGSIHTVLPAFVATLTGSVMVLIGARLALTQ